MSATLHHLTNKQGRKTSVVVSFEDCEKILEDRSDLAVIAARRGEPTIRHAEFKEGLKRNGRSR